MPSDKAYSTEQRLNGIVSALPMPVITSAPQTISTLTPSFANVTGMALTLQPGTYVVDVWLAYTENATASQQPRFQFTYSGSSSAATLQAFWQQNNSANSFGGNSAAAMGPVAGPNYTGSVQFLHLRLKIITTTAGTLQLQANTSASADTITIAAMADMQAQWWQGL